MLLPCVCVRTYTTTRFTLCVEGEEGKERERGKKRETLMDWHGIQAERLRDEEIL